MLPNSESPVVAPPAARASLWQRARDRGLPMALLVLSLTFLGLGVCVLLRWFWQPNDDIYLTCILSASRMRVASGYVADTGPHESSFKLRLCIWLMSGTALAAFSWFWRARRFSLGRLVAVVLAIGLAGSLPFMKPESRMRKGQFRFHESSISGEPEMLTEIQMRSLSVELQPECAARVFPDTLRKELGTGPAEAVARVELTRKQFYGNSSELLTVLELEFRPGLSDQQRDTVFQYYAHYLTCLVGDVYQVSAPMGQTVLVNAVLGANNTQGVWEKWGKAWEANRPVWKDAGGE